MTRSDLDEELRPSEPWHNSTRAVLGASAAGLAVIGVLIASVMYVTGRQEPKAPVDFVEPSFSATASSSPTSTTATITSTTPPSTTEINAPLTPTTPSTTDSSQTTSTGTATRPSPREGDQGPTSRTQRRPRTNITRTLLPQQAG